MKIENKRIFIGDLPESVTNEQLQTQFNKFGEISSIEIKQRKENSPKCRFPFFAYVNIDISNDALQKCFQSLSKFKWNGHYIKLELARESFLDRLKRERQENKAENTNSVPQTRVANIKKFKKEEKIDLNSPPANSNLQDVSQDQATIPQIKPLVNNTESNLRRLKSLKEKKSDYIAQKSLIKQALANVDSKSKKIIFNDDDEENSTAENKKDETIQIDYLFDPLDDGFEIKEQFQTKGGQKLLELQTKYNNDKRFMLNERFIDDDDNDNEAVDTEEIGKNSIESEKNTELRILEEVLNCKLNKKSFEKRTEKVTKTKTKELLNDSKSDKLLLSDSKNGFLTESKKQSEDETNKQIVEKSPAATQSKTFYKVSDNLKDTLKAKEQFSLLNMFCKTNEHSDNAALDQETTITDTKLPKLNGQNPFKYDSSDNEDEMEDIPYNNTTEESTPIAAEFNTKINSGPFWNDPFFFIDGDCRLREGFEFVKNLKRESKQFSEIRRDLKSIAKSKIRNVEKKNDKFKKKLGGSNKRRKQIRIKKAINR